jgi:hypothetical protein
MKPIAIIDLKVMNLGLGWSTAGRVCTLSGKPGKVARFSG